MLRLNLISKENRREIQLKRLYFLIKRVNWILSAAAIFLAAVFFGSDLVMKSNFAASAAAGAFIKNEGQKINDNKILSINQELSYAAQVQKDFIPASALIGEISSLLTKNIHLSRIKIDLDKKTAKFSGIAASREDFLYFEESLKSSKIFKNINSPLNSLLQKNDIEFEINAEMDLAGLEKS